MNLHIQEIPGTVDERGPKLFESRELKRSAQETIEERSNYIRRSFSSSRDSLHPTCENNNQCWSGMMQNQGH